MFHTTNDTDLINIPEVEPHLDGHAEVQVAKPDVGLSDDFLTSVLVDGVDLQVQNTSQQLVRFQAEQEPFFEYRVCCVFNSLQCILGTN